MSYYEVESTIASGITLTIIILVLVASKRHNDTDIFRIGPCNGDNCSVILGIAVDDWTTWAFLQTVIVIKQLVMSFAYACYRPWFYNVLMDHKCQTITRSLSTTLIMVGTYKSYLYMNEILNIILVMSQQLQYILPAFICETGVYLVMSYKAHSKKISL